MIPSKCKYLEKNNFEFKHVSVTLKLKCKYIYLKCIKDYKKYIKYIFTYLVQESIHQSLFGIPKKKKKKAKTKTPRRVYFVNYDRILFTYSLYSAANNQMGIETCENSIFI